jgi:hypothetical protein
VRVQQRLALGANVGHNGSPLAATDTQTVAIAETVADFDASANADTNWCTGTFGFMTPVGTTGQVLVRCSSGKPAAACGLYGWKP